MLHNFLSFLLCFLPLIHAHSSSQGNPRAVYPPASAHKKLIKRLASARSSEKSRNWSFKPREFFPEQVLNSRAANATTASAWNGTSAYAQLGTSGVGAMQMSVVDDRYVIIFDRAEHNPLTTSDGVPAWSALLDTHTHTVRALKVITNSFCAGKIYRNLLNPVFNFLDQLKGGGWLGNGTLIDYGGNPVESVPTQNGLMGIRLFTPLANGAGEVWEDPDNVHLTTNR